jgi:GT2 family glycosyltransferase
MSKKIEKPLVSVILPVYYGGNDVIESLKTLKNQTYENYEIIVVDDKSKDESYKKIKEKFSNIKIIVNNENLGFSKACNKGLNVAQGKYIMITDEDAFYDKNYIKEFVDVIEKDNKIGVVSSKAYYTNETNRIRAAYFNVSKFTGITKSIGRDEIDEGQYDKITEIQAAGGGASMFDAELFKKIGGFDENFFIYFSDSDICFRIRKLGYKVVFVPKAILYHKKEKGDVITLFLVDQSTKSKILFIRKHSNFFQKIVFIFYITLIYSSIFILRFAVKRRFDLIKIYIKSFFEGFFKKIK